MKTTLTGDTMETENTETLTRPLINKTVAKMQGLKEVRGELRRNGRFYISTYDWNPCEKPEQAWPMIQEVWQTLQTVCEYEFGLGLGPMATTIWEAHKHMHNCNELQAAMIVYIKYKKNVEEVRADTEERL